MKLSSISQMNDNWKMVSDCDVDTLGLATSIYEGKKVFSFLEDVKYLNSILNNTNITGLICTKEVYHNVEIPSYYGILLADDPKQTFFEIHNQLSGLEFYWQKHNNKISERAEVSKNAIIGENSISIGNNTIIEAGVIIHPGTIIGNNVIIRSGSQIGTNGFQFINNRKNVFSVKTAGRVVIKDNVEIQHNCCIDRGILGGDTIIEKDVKIDNLVHIAHDDHIGERTFITAGVKLAGRVTVGRDCWLGVNATISNGIIIGDNCKITLGSVVVKDVISNSTVTGNFAIDHKKFLKFMISIR